MARILKPAVFVILFFISTHFGMVVPEKMDRNFLIASSLLKHKTN
jgi:hypothetical protein